MLSVFLTAFDVFPDTFYVEVNNGLLALFGKQEFTAISAVHKTVLG